MNPKKAKSMSTYTKIENPFEVSTPETLSPQQISELFVDVFADFSSVKLAGHTFINGPRGCGKSMMLRYLEPDVQIAAGKYTNVTDIPFYAVHIPLKKSWADMTELHTMSGTPYYLVAEHLLCSQMLQIIFASLHRSFPVQDKISNFKKLLNDINSIISDYNGVIQNLCEINNFSDLSKVFRSFFAQAKSYYRKQFPNRGEIEPYNGALFSYSEVVIEILKVLKAGIVDFKTFYLLIDDADSADIGIQRIINTWVSMRTTDIVSLKIATQNRYKTYRTIRNQVIESPHDYNSISMESIYAKKGSTYFARVKSIIEKRLNYYGLLEVTAEEFFPYDLKQYEAIETIKNQLKKNFEEGKGKGGNRASDDVIRYAIPEYITSLGGKSKSTSTYSYAGFESLVNLSSGIIRWFLEPAATMFNDTVENVTNGNEKITKIPVSIQNQVIRKWSSDLLEEELDKYEKDNNFKPSNDLIDNFDDDDIIEYSIKEYNHTEDLRKYYRLKNLINALGMLFQRKLRDTKASERNVTSISIPDFIPAKLKEVLDLAVEASLLQKTSIGNKSGIGRDVRYILSRRLAPHYNIDASGYAYCLSVSAKDLVIALDEPRKFVNSRMKDKDLLLAIQLDIFEDEES